MNDKLKKSLLIAIAGVGVWWIVYSHLAWFAKWLTYAALHFEQGRHLSLAVEFFVFEVPKVLMLLALVVFGVGIIRSFFTPQRTRQILQGKSEFVGNILAALLGIVTPFCSCSAVPLFIGFVTTGIPLGVTLSFLISAPMINEIALVMLFGLFGWKVAALYVSTGLFIAITSGWILGKLHLEKYIEEWVFQTPVGRGQEEQVLSWEDRIRAGQDAVRDIVGKVWP
jgi:uncharacterized membrane protein YraQ (UPF0718 family)